MRSGQTLAILPVLLVACYGACVSAQDAENPVRLEQILGSGPEVDPKALWQKIVRSDFELSSLADKRHGYFEFFHHGHDSAENVVLVRGIYDDDGTRRIQILPFNDNLYCYATIDNLWLMVGRTGEWEKRRARGFTFQVDEDHLTNYGDSSGRPPEYQSGGFIKFSLGSYLAAWFEPEVRSTNWNGATRTFTVTRTTGSRASIRFRTPHDQRRFGTILGDLRIQGSAGSDVCFRSFIVDCSSPLRLNIDNIATLPVRLDAVDETKDPQFPGFPHITTAEGRAAVNKLDREIGVLTCTDPRETQRAESPTRFHEWIYWSIHTDQHKVRPSFETKGDYAYSDQFLAKVVSEFEIAYLSIQSAITGEDDSSDPIVDDPNILWLGLERTVFPHAALLTYNMFKRVLASEQLPIGGKLKLCMVMGEFGPPSWAVTEAGSVESPDRPFLEAVLHARWNWLPTEEEIALCQEKLAEEWPRPLEHEAAIDSLIRWGRLEDVPEELLDEWLRTKLAASDMQRHCTWKALTRTPSGRAFLFRQWDTLAEKPELQREVAEILCHRARATLDMKRFDFMTEQECKKALQLCEPLIK